MHTGDCDSEIGQFDVCGKWDAFFDYDKMIGFLDGH